MRARDTSGNPSAQSAPLPVTTLASAAPVFADGFESGDLSAWTHHRRAHHRRQRPSTAAPIAAEGNTTAAGPYAKKTLPSTYPDAYARVWFQVVSQTSQVNLLRLRDAAGDSIGFAYIGTTGRLGFHNDALGTNIAERHEPGTGLARPRAPRPDRWSRAAWSRSGSTTSGSLTCPAPPTTSAAPVGRLQIGETQTTGQTYDVVFDDAAFGTARLGPVADSPPSVPANLAATTPSPYSVSLTWGASTDDLGVVGYDLFRDGAPYQSLGNVLTYADTVAESATPHIRGQGSGHVGQPLGADRGGLPRPRRPIIPRPSRQTSRGRLHHAHPWS